MLTPDNIIHRAVRQAHEAGQRAALDRAFSALGRSIVEPVLTKAHELAQPQPAAPQHDHDPHAALLLAQLDHAIRCLEQHRDPKPGDAALHALWHEPDALAGVIGPHLQSHPRVQKAIAYALYLKAAERAPKGGVTLPDTEGKTTFYVGGQWIPAKVIAQLAPEHRKQLDDVKGAAASGRKPVKGKESPAPAPPDSLALRRKVAEIASDILLKPGEHTPDKFRDLAEAVAAGTEADALTPNDLRALKLRLSAMFGDQRQIVAALLAHADHALGTHEAVSAATVPTGAKAGDQQLPSPNEPTEPPQIATGAPADGKPPQPDTYAFLPIDSITVDPARFQFKAHTDPLSGVTDSLKRSKRFNRDFAGVISVWFDPANGTTNCINGHHRLEIAKRFGEKHLLVHYLDAKDEREARAKGALINIADDRGTAIDAAKFLRDSGKTEADLVDEGVSPDGPVMRDAGILSHLNDAAFHRLTTGGLDFSTAIAVAKHVTDPARQEKLFKIIEGGEYTGKHVEEMARQMAAAPSASTTTSTLWGDETSEDDTFVERADLASHVRGELAKEHHDYGALSSERRAGATAEAGNVLNVGENKRRAAEAEVNRHAFDSLAHNKGAVSDALDRGAVALKQAKTKKEKENARRETLAAVRAAVANIASGRQQPAGQPADGGGVEGVGAVRAQDSSAERAPASPTGAGQAAEDGGGPRDAAAGLIPEPPAPASVPEPFPPNESPSAASAAPAPAPTPLHALAHLAGNPDALRAESERLAALAGKTRAQGGSLEYHDAMTAALRGEHGPEVRDAVSRGLDDWESHQGSTAKRYARAAEEVAKIGQKSPEESHGGEEAKPQAEAAETAPAEAEPEALGEKEPAAPEPSPLEKLAEGAIPREELRKTHSNLQKYSDLHEHGYSISHWLNPTNPEEQVLEYNPRDLPGKPSGKPRLTAKNGEEVDAIHEALGLPKAEEQPREPSRFDEEKGVVLSKKEAKAKTKASGEPVELPDVPVADVPAAMAGAAPKPSSSNAPSGRTPRGGGKRKAAAPEPATNYSAEAHTYSVESGKDITQHPGMDAVELAKAAHAANPALPAEHAAHARKSHVPSLMSIPKGDSRFVAGHRVRRLGSGKFQVERKDGYLTGTADEVSEHIRSSWANQEGYESLPGALDRAAKYDEPDPFTDVARSADDAKLRDEIPDGTRAVSLDDDTKGRVGVVKRDADTGSARLVLDGGEETKATDFEPLDAAHSWRASEAERNARRPKGGKTGDLFDKADEADVSASVSQEEKPKGFVSKLPVETTVKRTKADAEKSAPAHEESAALFDNEKANLLNQSEEAATEPSSSNETKTVREPTDVLRDFAKTTHAHLNGMSGDTAARLGELRREYHAITGRGNTLDEDAKPYKIHRPIETIKRDLAKIQKRLDHGIATRKEPLKGSTRASSTTWTANQGKSAQVRDALKDELRAAEAAQQPSPPNEPASAAPAATDLSSVPAKDVPAAIAASEPAKATEALPEKPKEKESHEMTRAEHAQFLRDENYPVKNKDIHRQEHDETILRHLFHDEIQADNSARGVSREMQDIGSAVRRNAGKRKIQDQHHFNYADRKIRELYGRAIAAGKTVPPEVLADYPDLVTAKAAAPAPEPDLVTRVFNDPDHPLNDKLRERFGTDQGTGAKNYSPTKAELRQHLATLAKEGGAGFEEPQPPANAVPELPSPNVPASAEPPPAPTAPAQLPHVALSSTLADRLRSGSLEKNELWKHADAAFGGTRAEGKYGPSEAYDALEAGLNKSLRGRTDPTADLPHAQEQARALEKIVNSLPTQTNRSGNKESHQQFSTPPHYSFAANWVANLKPGEHVLEPSAGTGNLTTHAQNAGAVVHANELDNRRADFLRDQLESANVHNENAEQIAGILPKKGVKPSVVVMNPPFSQTAGRMGNKKELLTGARHIEEAGKMLAPGGRLVSIVGGGTARGDPTRGAGMSPGAPTYKKWFADMAKKGFTLRANVGIGGDEYKKYGTTFPTRMLVFDKRPPTADDKPVLGDATDIPDLMAKLEGVRNDRPELADEPPGEQVRGGATEEAERPTGAEPAAGTGAGVAEAGEAEKSAVAGVPDGITGAGEPTGGGRPGVGGEPAGAGVRTTSKRGRKAAAGAGAVPAAEGTSEPTAGVPEGAADGGERGAGARGEPVQQSAPVLPGVRAPERIPVEPIHAKESEAQAAGASGESLYQSYRPARMKIAGAKPHITKLVESAAMAGVDPPVPTYSPTLSPDVVENAVREVKTPDGKTVKKPIGLSEAGLESVVYAGQAHQNFLQAAEGDEPARRGFMSGDGTGAGKGRQIAGIILDNVNQGKPKHVWISEKDKLFNDAKRDWADMGQDPADVIHWDQLSKGDFKAPKGTVFTTYSTLRSGPKDQTAPRNVDRLIDWLGKDFDGVIAFDESHAMGNADDTPGPRGVTKASQQALAGLKLQKALPKAKVVYVSATGATKPENLAYGERLGLWGRGTAFTDKRDFLEQMNAGGTSAMEAVAQSMKARGLYLARSMSYDGVKTDRLAHQLTDEQKFVYDNLAEGWQSVLQNIDKALEHIAGSKEDVKHAGAAKSAAMSQFQGAQQRFFNQVITSMMVPTVVNSMEKDLAEGRSPVVQLVNTMEAATKRALSGRDEGEDLEEIDISPKQMLVDFLKNSFPVHRLQKEVDENDNVRMVVAKNSGGKPIEDPAAVALRDELIEKTNDLKIPQSPLDQIVNHFGHESVAEATGRTVRLVKKADDTGTVRLTEERRNPKIANEGEARAFQSGKKKVMVFSEAGGTGASYHADKNAGNQGQRSHYLLQPGWRADKAVQGLGRTHRTNQTSAPIFHLMEAPDIPGQKRFVSTIAKRLGQLGALTRGQAKTGGGVELFNAADNLESKEAQAGLESFLNSLKRGGVVNDMGYHELMPKLGFKVDTDAGGGGAWRTRGQSEVPEMRQFLNRVLALKLADQQEVFRQLDEHMQSKIEQARADGTLDNGVERFPADKVERSGDDQTVYRDPETGAEAKLVATKVTRKNAKRAWAENTKGKRPLKFVKNDRSGRVWAVYEAAPKTDARNGNIVPMYTLRGPGGDQHLPTFQVDNQSYHSTGYDDMEHDEAKTLWEQQHAELPETVESDEHFVTGDLLSVWDKLPGDRPKIYRVPLSDGTSIVGRHIPPGMVEGTMKKLGATQRHAEGDGHDPADVHQAVLARGDVATLANGWRVKRSRVGGENRVELDGPISMHRRTLQEDGVRVEKIASQLRYFIPSGEGGAKVLERVMRSRNAPVTEVRPAKAE